MLPMFYNESSIGLFAEANGYVNFNYILGLVYKWDDPEMRIIPWEQTPEYRRGIETILKWTNNGYLLRDLGIVQIDIATLIATSDEDNTALSLNRVGSFIAPLDLELRANAILKSKKC